MSKKLDFNRPMQLRGGEQVLLATKDPINLRSGPHYIFKYRVTAHEDVWSILLRKEDGRFWTHAEHTLDVINVPEKVMLPEITVYKDIANGSIHALEAASNPRFVDTLKQGGYSTAQRNTKFNFF